MTKRVRADGSDTALLSHPDHHPRARRVDVRGRRPPQCGGPGVRREERGARYFTGEHEGTFLFRAYLRTMRWRQGAGTVRKGASPSWGTEIRGYGGSPPGPAAGAPGTAGPRSA